MSIFDIRYSTFKKKDHPRPDGPFFNTLRLAVASVHRLALVLLAAVSGLLDELLAFLGEGITEITAAAEAHLLQGVLDV